MFNMIISTSTATIPDKITLPERIIKSIYYQEYLKSVNYFEQEKREPEWLRSVTLELIKREPEWLRSVTLELIKREPEWLRSVTLESSLLTENIEEITLESLNAAEIFNALRLQRQEIELSIVSKFKNIEQVTAIYTQKYRYELQIIVFLNMETYNNGLMHKLLDLEYDLQKQFQEPLLAFSYIPKIYKNRRDIVHPNALLIFEK